MRSIAVAFNGGKEPTEEERQVRSLAGFARDSSLWCSLCRTEFAEGDVVYRRRASREGPGFYAQGWELDAICDTCVSDWHPSWRENRREPIPCAGGCGVLVSHWYRDVYVDRTVDKAEGPTDYYRPAFSTCSRRCSELATLERKRVKRNERTCAVCLEMFTPKRADARYCSNACRQDAYRRRKQGFDV